MAQKQMGELKNEGSRTDTDTQVQNIPVKTGIGKQKPQTTC